MAAFASCPRSSTPAGGDQHLGLESYLVTLPIATAVEDAPQVGGSPSLAANREGGIHQRLLGKRSQKGDRIEEIGLADPVHAGDTSERTKRYIHIDQILETVEPPPLCFAPTRCTPESTVRS